MHSCKHACMHACTHTYTHTYMHECMHFNNSNAHTCTSICMHLQLYVNMQMQHLSMLYVNIIHAFTHMIACIFNCMHIPHREPKCYQESSKRGNTCFRNYVSPKPTDCVKHTQMLGHLHEIIGIRHHFVWIGVDFLRTGLVVI